LIAHDESKKRHAMVSRSASEALSLAQSLKKQIESGESMAKLAKRHSNDPTASRGGFLGASERGSWVPEFENTAFSLRVGEVSEPVETVFGIHILRREPLEEIRLSHILVAHKDAQGVAKKTSEIGQRSPEAALRIAQLALKDLDDGTSFPEVAEQFSDGPMGRRGAHLGWFVRGELGPTFDQAAFALDVGETSAVFESVFGYHIIRREE
jgi:parvulin-like peptidyl-prolyl isomerase